MTTTLGLDERKFLERWSCSFISRTEDPESYVAKFPCPKCGADAFEMFVEVTAPSKAVARRFNLDDYELWVLRWTSECGHVCGAINEAACVATLVEEKGKMVGMIEPVSPPPWVRYEEEGARGAYVAFGTFWQAKHATNAQFRRLTALRKDEPEMFEVKRKMSLKMDGGEEQIGG